MPSRNLQLKLKHIESVAMPQNTSRIRALESGALHVIEGGLSPDDMDLFAGRNEFTSQSIATGDWRGIIFRSDIPPFDDVRVRQAVRMVVDRQEMIELIANGDTGAVVACDTPVWSGDQYYVPTDCGPNIEGAKQLLKEAGHNELKFQIHTSDLDTFWEPMLEVYQYQAAKAGINVEIVERPSTAYWSEVWMVEPVVTTLWLERPAAQILAEAFSSDAVYNETYWKSSQFDQIFAEANRTLEYDERLGLYQELQQLLWEESGALIPFHLKQGRVLSSSVHGIKDEVGQFSIPWHEVYLSSQ